MPTSTMDARNLTTFHTKFVETNQPIEEKLRDTYRLIQQDADVQRFLHRFPNLQDTQKQLQQQLGQKVVLVNEEID